MSLIDRASTFRGRIADHGVSKSSGGFPQLILQLVATEIYDVDEQAWVDWSEYDVNEIQAYLVLFGGKGETLNSQQVKKVTGWDGLSFAGLAALDLSKTKIQFRVEENTYEGKTNLQVSWIDEYDAEPGRTVCKLDAAEMKSLDAEYASLLKSSGKKAAPAKAKGKITKTNVKSTQPKGPVTKKNNDPLGPPTGTTTAAPTETKTTPPAPAANPNLPTGHCTKDEAWETVYDMKAKDVSDEKIANIWTDAIKKIAPGVEQENITDEQWFAVRQVVLDKAAAF
ncbi:hypothetical protein LCGC14_0360100 [marine sediment metagenome]|uniref:Uncharacterized protein n=1 Tax=marine sediment metagenome TaxID=412755 RepID=A0A0F9VVJ2_9ZZZZ